LDKVTDDHVPVLIIRQNRKPAVMSMEDFKFYEATAFLMARPDNAMRLNQTMVVIEAAVDQNLLEE
jgi:antitoxin YefM